MSRLLVSNLSTSISKEDIRVFFKFFGEVQSVKLEKNQETKKFDAIVFFSDSESAAKILKSDKKHSLKGQVLEISLFKKIKPKENIVINNDNDDSNSCDSEGNFAKFINDQKHYIRARNFRKKQLSGSVKKRSAAEVNDLIGQANNFYINNQYDDAILVLHEVIRLSPDLQEPYKVLSLIYEIKGDLTKCLDFKMLAAQLSPGEVDLWIQCANLNRKIGNKTQAEYCITRALKNDKDNVMLLEERANILEEVGEVKKSAQAYERLYEVIANLGLVEKMIEMYESLKQQNEIIELIERQGKTITMINIAQEDNSSSQIGILLKYFDICMNNEMYRNVVNFYQAYVNENTSLFELPEIYICYLISSVTSCRETKDLMLVDSSKDDSIYRLVESLKNVFTRIDKIRFPKRLSNLSDVLEKFNYYSFMQEIINFLEEKESNCDSSDTLKQVLIPYTKIADVYANQSGNSFNSDLAIKYYLKALSLSSSSESIIVRLKLSELYKSINDFNNALEILNNKVKYEEDFNFGNEYLEENQKKPLQELNDAVAEENDFNNEYFKIKYQNDDLNNDQCSEENIEVREEEPQKNTVHNSFLHPSKYNIQHPVHQNLGRKGLKFKVASKSLEYDENEITDKSSKYFLSKKRLRILSCHKKKELYLEKDNLLKDYIRKYKKKWPSSSIKDKSKYEIILKSEYESLSNDISSMKNNFMKLKESLIYMQRGENEKFLENTYRPLSEVLTQEIRLLEFKVLVFKDILNYSNIKNFFSKSGHSNPHLHLPNFGDIPKVKNEQQEQETENFQEEYVNGNYLEDEDENEDVISAEAIRPDLKSTDINDPLLSSNLFQWKVQKNTLLARKKVKKSMELTEEKLHKIESLDKFIKKDCFLKMIVYFIKLSHEKRDFQNSNSIVKLLLSSPYNDKFRQNGLSFILYTYAFLNSIELKNFNSAYKFLKKTSLLYNLKDLFSFWIQVNQVTNSNSISRQLLRSSLYKLSLNKSFEKNDYVNFQLGCCYMQTGNNNLALRYIHPMLEKTRSPSIYLLQAAIHSFKYLSRKVLKKAEELTSALNNINTYAVLRKDSFPEEVSFNLARFFHFIGHNTLALEFYEKAKNDSKYFKSSVHKRKNISNLVNYNLAIYYKSIGSTQLAHDLLINNITI